MKAEPLNDKLICFVCCRLKKDKCTCDSPEGFIGREEDIASAVEWFWFEINRHALEEDDLDFIEKILNKAFPDVVRNKK